MLGFLDSFPVTTDPLWPWSLPAVGWPALILTALLLVGGAVWSYRRASGASGTRLRRVGVVLSIRIALLILVFLALSGASCVSRDDLEVPSLLVVAVDASASMYVVKDEHDGQSRWDYLLSVLRDCKPLIERLREEHNIKVVFFRFGAEVGEFDPDNPGIADGKRTDTAQALRYLFDKYRGERYLRGLVILSDGADNVASDPPARSLATMWRNLPAPVHTFHFGSKTTTPNQNDVIVTSLKPEPAIVAVKGKLTVEATIDALGGVVGSRARVRVFLNGKEAAAKTETLALTRNNLVRIVCDAPTDPGEIKVTLKVDPVQGGESFSGEMTAANNKMETYVTVAREGLSVLLIERQERFPEPQMLLSALAADKRMRVYVAWLRGGVELTDKQRSLFQFDQHPYDVIILGDVPAARLLEADPDALKKIRYRVFNHRTGFLMMGGKNSFANGGWHEHKLINEMMPVDLAKTGQSASRVEMVPTTEGLNYVLRLADNAEDSLALWRKIQLPGGHPKGELNGYTTLGGPEDRRPGAKPFAQTKAGNQLMVARDYGRGRTMVFGGDTTYLWVRPDTGGREAHARFWRQMVLWLAHQEDSDDILRVRPDIRRLRTGDNLGFGVELRGKQGEAIKDPRYQVKIIDEQGNEFPVDVAQGMPGATSPAEARGAFKPKRPGEYRIVATGSGTDPSGKKIDGKSEARFLVYQDHTETTETAANPDFLRDLAAAGGGQDHRPSELRAFLEELPSRPLPQPPPKPAKYPDWRTTKGPSPFLLAFFLLFVQLLALEWFLRRRWGMV